MFAGLADRHFRCVLADPPWDFSSNSKTKPGRNPRRHYDCMPLRKICELPVQRYGADQSVLFLWITGPFLVKGYHIPVMRAWGYEPTAMGFVWIKTNPSAGNVPFFTIKSLFNGPGFTTRKNAEFVVIGKRGKSTRIDCGVHEVIVAPRREHSRKPDESYRRIERYCTGPRLELFGRQQRDGWEVRGNQSHRF